MSGATAPSAVDLAAWGRMDALAVEVLTPHAAGRCPCANGLSDYCHGARMVEAVAARLYDTHGRDRA